MKKTTTPIQGKERPLVTEADIETKINLIDKRLIALGHQIDDTEDSELICKLVGLRSNLLFKRRALKDRIELKTKNVLEYNIVIVQ